MSLTESLIAELQQEAGSARKMLERIPEDKLTWKPHDKSMSLGRLASHVAENPFWVYTILDNDEFDFSKSEYKESNAASSKDALKLFDDMMSKATDSLKKSNDDKLMEKWVMRNGDQIYMDLPRVDAIRMFGYSHFIHHRAQLGVYLRLLDVPVPSVYGPTADEGMM